MNIPYIRYQIDDVKRYAMIDLGSITLSNKSILLGRKPLPCCNKYIALSNSTLLDVVWFDVMLVPLTCVMINVLKINKRIDVNMDT